MRHVRRSHIRIKTKLLSPRQHGQVRIMLLTKKQKENINKKYPLYSQDGKRKNAVCVAKFFIGDQTWYITEGFFEDGDFCMFGIAINGWGAEYGYVSYKELQYIKVNVKTPFGKMPQSVERDIFFTPKPLCDIKDKALQKFLSRQYDDEEENKAV